MRTSIRILALCLALSLLAMACGDSDDDSSPDAAAGTSDADTDDGDGDTDTDDIEDAGSGAADFATGGDFGIDDTGQFVNPCGVLTDDEVAAATGLTVLRSEDQGPLGCRWFVENVDPNITADDAISWQPFRTEQFEAQREALEQGLDGEEIAGLGNGAFFIGNDAVGEVWALLDTLSFRVGNHFAFGSVDARPVQESLAAALVTALSGQ